jgi:hypothetical protein
MRGPSTAAVARQYESAPSQAAQAGDTVDVVRAHERVVRHRRRAVACGLSQHQQDHERTLIEKTAVEHGLTEKLVVARALLGPLSGWWWWWRR